MSKAIPYGRQFIDQDDIDAVVATLQSDFLTQGPTIHHFEEAFAAFIGCKHAVAVSNGTAALHLSVLALGLKPGDKVITTPITFAASANCVEYCGGEIEFCDIDENTFLIDVNKLEAKLKSQPKGYYKGIIPVDFSGLSVDLERVRQLANEHGCWVLEDACHAPGARFTDSKGVIHAAGDGSLANCSIFSFHPVKHIACGEGGMVTTNDSELAEKIRLLRTHGITKDESMLEENDGGWYYEMFELGYNYRLSDIQAALGISQLRKLQDSLDKRNEIAKKYNNAFVGQKLQLQTLPEKFYHAYHLYIIQVKDRKGLYDKLRKEGIYAQVHYIPVHKLPYYRKKGNFRGQLSKAEQYYQSCLSLPMYPTLTNEEQLFVIDKVLDFVNIR